MRLSNMATLREGVVRHRKSRRQFALAAVLVCLVALWEALTHQSVLLGVLTLGLIVTTCDMVRMSLRAQVAEDQHLDKLQEVYREIEAFYGVAPLREDEDRPS